MAWLDLASINSFGIKHTAVLGAEILTEKYNVDVLGAGRLNHVLCGAHAIVCQSVHQIADHFRIFVEILEKVLHAAHGITGMDDLAGDI